jgi:hypothetical protein
MFQVSLNRDTETGIEATINMPGKYFSGKKDMKEDINYNSLGSGELPFSERVEGENEFQA